MAGKRRGPYALSDEERARRSALARELHRQGRFGGREIAVQGAERRKAERSRRERAEEIERVAREARERADAEEAERRANPVIYRDADGTVIPYRPPRRTLRAPSPWQTVIRPP